MECERDKRRCTIGESVRCVCVCASFCEYEESTRCNITRRVCLTNIRQSARAMAGSRLRSGFSSILQRPHRDWMLPSSLLHHSPSPSPLCSLYLLFFLSAVYVLPSLFPLLSASFDVFSVSLSVCLLFFFFYPTSLLLFPSLCSCSPGKAPPV